MSATAIGLTVIATAITGDTITIVTIIPTATITLATTVLVGITGSDNGWVTRRQFRL